MLKRIAHGRPFGMAVLAEGIGLRLPQDELVQAMPDVERDEHGHVRLAELELDRLLAKQVKDRFRAHGQNVTVEGKSIGYELDNPVVLNRFAPEFIGVFPFTIMFIITAVTTQRERARGTLERLMTMPLGKLDLLAAGERGDALEPGVEGGGESVAADDALEPVSYPRAAGARVEALGIPCM
jgi:hypothetical protein